MRMRSTAFALIALLAVGCSSCKTLDLPPPVAEAGACVGRGAISLLDDVASALITDGWQRALEVLEERWGPIAIRCAIQEVGSMAYHNYQSGGDGLERLKAERATRYLKAHPVGP